ncbi:60S ribosomal protein L6 [Zopfochytrium polystomum]|nr:60S ribosomal protein L6 [Zopfochytrium polystomum]
MPSTKNPSLIPGVSKYSRSAAYRLKGRFNIKKAKTPPKAPKPTTKVVPVGGAKNGNARVVPLVRAPKYYPAEDVRKPKISRKAKKPVPTKIRPSITPGTVLIILAGRFAGKRVVFLKALPSGLLLITGPFKINGVPLRRVNQAYVIATSTKVDISGVTIPETITDATFKKEKAAKKADTEEALFGKKVEVRPVDAAKVALQKSVDASIVASLKKDSTLKAYLNASFYLTKGQAPHKLKF